jgi:hypothetical protein
MKPSQIIQNNEKPDNENRWQLLDVSICISEYSYCFLAVYLSGNS